MKKILSLVLVVAMMASLVVLAPTASAAENGYSIEVTDAGAVAQGTKGLTADIIVTTPDTLFTAQLAIDYDKTRIENVVIDTADVKAFPTTGTVGGFPYTMTFFASGIAAVDASAGFTYLTVTYDIKADAPAGDAYIRVAPVPDTTKIYIAPTDATTTATAIYDWTVIDGGATVLPEGYSKAPAIPADELWDFDSATGTIYAYLGEELSGDIAIPSQIGGVDVVEIYADGASVIDGLDVTSIVVPATVEYISAGAFLNLASCTAIYILNPDCEIEDTAMGYDGSWRRQKLTVTGQTLDADENTLLTLYGYADSTAQTYAETGDGEYPFGWGEYVAPTTVTIVAGDNTSAFEVSGNTVKAPGASRVDGRVTVAWDVNGTKVAPGAEVAIDGDTTFTAITVAAPETTYGASVKATESEVALRFTAEFAKAEYDALVTAFGAGNVKHGMLISTQAQIEAAGEFTHNVAKKLDFEMTGCWKIEGDNYVFAASVKNFTDKTIANNYDFNAVAYVGIDLDGNGTVDTYVYGDYDWTCARDAKTVLGNYIADLDPEGDVYGWVNTWYSKFN